MSKHVKSLLAIAAAVVLLAGLWVVLRTVSEKKNPSPDQPGLENTLFTNYKREDVESFHVVNQKSEFTLKKTGENAWGIDQISGYERNEDTFQYVLTVLPQIEYLELLKENADNLEEFGLLEPWASGEITYRDGTVLALELGIEVPNTAGNRYGRLQGGKDVYILPLQVVKTFGYSLAEYVSAQVIPSSPGTDTITELVLSGRERPEPIVIAPTKPTAHEGISYYPYMVESPCVAPISVYEGEDLVLLPHTGFTAKSTIEIQPTDETIAAYGLDDPDYTLSYVYQGKRTTLLFSWQDRDRKLLTCMVEGGGILYQVSADNADETGWIDAQLVDVVFKYIYYAKQTQVQRVTYTSDKGMYVFDLDQKTDGEGNVTLTVTCNGSKLEDSENFRNFFSVISYVRWEDIISGAPPEGEADVRIQIDFLPELGLEPDILTYTRTSERRYAMSVNGNTHFDVASTYIHKIQSDLDKLFEGSKITTEY